jgi:hypothetical protein
MSSTFALAPVALFAVLLAGSGATQNAQSALEAPESVVAAHAATQPSCPPGAIWAGSKCRMQRTIVLEEAAPPPPPPPPPPPSALSLDWWVALIS